VGKSRTDKQDRRRSPSLRTASVFRVDVECGNLGQAYHRYLSKTRAEAVEPSLDADGCDRKIAGRGIVNTRESPTITPLWAFSGGSVNPDDNKPGDNLPVNESSSDDPANLPF
jgi:hypothetical protein